MLARIHFRVSKTLTWSRRDARRYSESFIPVYASPLNARSVTVTDVPLRGALPFMRAAFLATIPSRSPASRGGELRSCRPAAPWPHTLCFRWPPNVPRPSSDPIRIAITSATRSRGSLALPLGSTLLGRLKFPAGPTVPWGRGGIAGAGMIHKDEEP